MAENSMKPRIRFKGYTDAWEQRKFSYYFEERNERSGEGELISVTVSSGIKKFSELGRYDSKPEDMSNYKRVIEGDIAYNSMRMWQGASGYSPYTGILSPAYTVITPKYGISAIFFSYLIKRPYMIHLFEINSQGLTSDTWNLKYPAFSKIETKAPIANDEQNKIAAIFVKIDNLITLHQRKYDKIVNIKKALLEKMFPSDAETTPKIRFKGFTDAWEQRKLGDCIELGSGRDYKHLSEGNIPVYGTGGYMLSVNKALSYEKDGIGIGRKGTIDKPYLLKAPFWTVDTLFFAVPKEKNAIFFLLCLFSKIDWKSKDESTGVPSLSKQTINTVDINIPQTVEQEALGSIFQKIDNLITLHQRQLEKLKNIKSALLEKMFV